MVKASLLLILFALLLPCCVYSQNGSKDQQIEVSVSARVINSIELVTLQSMKISRTEAQNGVITIDPLRSANSGKMVAIGAPNSNIKLSFIDRKELTQSRSSETLIFEYKIAGSTQDDQATAELLDIENRDLRFSSEGKLYLWIGGSVDVSTAVPGNYQGEFTVEVEYI